MPDMSLWASHTAAIKANVFEGPCAKRSCWNPGEGCRGNSGRQEPHSLYSWWWDKVSGKLRSIAWCPRRAALHELPSVSHSLLKLSENGCFTFFSCPESDTQRWSQCLLVTPVSQIPGSSGPQCQESPFCFTLGAATAKDKYHPLLHRFSIAQGYNGLSNGCIKWSLTIISSLCAYKTTASYKWFLMAHAVSRNRVIAI